MKNTEKCKTCIFKENNFFIAGRCSLCLENGMCMHKEPEKTLSK